MPDKKAVDVTKSGITCTWEFDPSQPAYDVSVVDKDVNVIQGLSVLRVSGTSYTFPKETFDMSILPDSFYCQVSVSDLDMCV